MSGEVVYKPIKKGLETWSNMPDKTRHDDMGRVIVNIEIGVKQIISSGKICSVESMCEDMYIDILKGLVVDKLSYMTYVNLASEPKITISYDGRLVIHNDKISGYVEDIMTVLNDIEDSIKYDALVDFVLNENVGNKYGEAFRRLVNVMQKKCKKEYASALIGLVLKEYICEDCRSIEGDEAEEIHYMSYEDLLMKTGQIMKNRNAGGDKESEKIIKEELLYRFLQGDLIVKGSR